MTASHPAVRRVAAAVLAGIAFCWGQGTPTVATALPSVTTPCGAGAPATGDYNGDGAVDLAVTTWRNEVDRSGLFVSLDRTARGAWLDIRGETLSNADLNGDKCADAIVTGWDIGTKVTLLLGTPSGLDSATATTLVLPQSAGFSGFDKVIARSIGFVHDGISQVVVAGFVYLDADQTPRNPFVDVFTLDGSGKPGPAQVLDMTGLVTDVNEWRPNLAADDGVLVAGVADTVNGKRLAGAVHVFTPDATDRRLLVHRAAITQATPGVTGTPEAYDSFGQSVALRDGYLAIGTPHESLGKAKYAGQVQLMRWNAAAAAFKSVRALDQNTKGVVGTNESRDYFGTAVVIARGLTATSSYDVVIGTPFERVGSATAAGAFTVASFTKPTYRTYTQNTKGVPGTAERPDEQALYGDRFGAAFGVLATSATTDILAVGAPGETNGDCLNQGYVILSDGKRLSSSTRWTRLSPPTTGCSHFDAEVFMGWGAGFGDSQWYEP